MRNCIVLYSLLLLSFSTYSQITSGGANASVYTLTSTTKGILTPRMTETERLNIVTPATGLLVYQTDNVQGFYFYAGSAWKNLATATYVIQDTDQNTKVQVEKTTDDDIIRFDLDGNEKMTLKNNANNSGSRIEFPDNSGNILIGNETGKVNTGTNNIFIGDSSAINNSSGSFNVALGKKSLFNNNIGHRNLAIGSEALLQNTADSNFAIGHKALRSNTTGKLNTSLGYESMLNSTIGNYNTTIGNAMMANTSGSSNVVTGWNAMPFNTTGSHNTAVGSNAMNDNQTGDFNSVMSVTYSLSGPDYSRTLGSNVDGYENTVAGLDAIKNATSIYQTTALGTHALSNVTTGINNLAIGSEALRYMTTGENNIGIGHHIFGSATTDSRNIVIGRGNDFTNLVNTYETTNMTSINVDTLGNESESNNGVIIGIQNGISNQADNVTAIGNKIYVSQEDDQTIIGSITISPQVTNNVITLGTIDSRIGIGTASPHPSSIIDISSTKKGVLFPRIMDKEAINVGSGDYELIIYDKTLNSYYKSDPNVGGDGYRWTNLNNMFDKYTAPNYVEQEKIPVWDGTLWKWSGTERLEDIDGNSNMRFTTDAANRFVIRLDGQDKFRTTAFVNTAPNDNKMMIEPLTINNALYFGNNAGLNAATSADNTGIGYNALKNVNTLGVKNTAFGSESLVSNTSGSNNTAVGKNALMNNTVGIGNTALGVNALLNNINGDYNTAVGFAALNDPSDGNYNTAFGYDAEVNGAGINYATAIGPLSRVSQSHSMVLGAISGVNGATNSSLVGINKSIPEAALHIRAYDGSDDPLITLQNDDLGFARLKFRALANTAEEWAMLGKPASANADARFNFHFTQDVLSIHGDGDAVLAGTLTQTSDKKLKKNIQRLIFNKSYLSNINGYYYYWKDAERSAAKQVGFLAQEVETCFPDLVQMKDGIKSLNYFGFTPVILEGIKQADHDTDEISKRINDVSDELQTLKKELAELKKYTPDEKN